MKKNKEQLHSGAWDAGSYETGSTCPPKSRGSLAAVLLVVTIVLCGIITVMGIMNIRLFQLLLSTQGQQAKESLQLIQQDSTLSHPTQNAVTEETENQEIPVRLGLVCVTVSTFDRQYYLLPEGCLVVDVRQDTPAALGDIRVGDVILSIDGQAVPTAQELRRLMQACLPGGTVEVQLYRSFDDREMTVQITLE